MITQCKPLPLPLPTRELASARHATKPGCALAYARRTCPLSLYSPAGCLPRSNQPRTAAPRTAGPRAEHAWRALRAPPRPRGARTCRAGAHPPADGLPHRRGRACRDPLPGVQPHGSLPSYVAVVRRLRARRFHAPYR